METGQIIVHHYQAVKVNKCDIQYQIIETLPTNSPLTERVKVEAFQGFSNAHNLGEYFRLRGTTNWKDGKQVTGLWKTETPNFFYGDQRTNEGKSLIVFHFKDNRETLVIYTYPSGYYPHKNTVEQIVKSLR